MPTPKIALDIIQKNFPEYSKFKYRKSGGFKDVYIATKGDVEYVIKILEPKHLDRVEREIRAFNLITSPFVARLLQYGKKTIKGKEYIYFIEEYVEGEELSDLIKKRNQFSNTEILHFLECTVLGVKAMWEPHKIVHRDIKPANIIIKLNGNPVILDLGLARHLTLTSLTPTGYVGIGTPSYRSPEQIKALKREIDLRSDFFCLGICAYMMATLTHPFNALDVNIIDENFYPKPPQEINHKISLGVSNLIMKFIERKDYKRPKDSDMALSLINETRKDVK